MISPLAALLRLHEMVNEGEDSPEMVRVAQSLSPTLARKFEITRRRFGATAVVPMERGVCKGCYTCQPAMVPEIDDDVHECFNCGRLIYDPDIAYDYFVG
ncbi:MAG: hypothetical protein JJU11_13335 [Candidatus Sumerlaeia bacterium]|nr:hypothetical protein [Candidatus Sumerlaeia bacterium]